MATSTVLRKGFSLRYDNNGGTFSYLNLKLTATDQAIHDIAVAYNNLQTKSVKTICKVVEEEITA